MTSAIEKATLLAWQVWGEGWAMFTRCSRCGEMKHCRGRRRDGMLCITCFDEKAPR